MTNNKKNENENKNNKPAIYSIFTILVLLLLVTVAGTKIIQDRNEKNKLSELENSAYEDEIDIGRDTENIADEPASAQTDTTSTAEDEQTDENTTSAAAQTTTTANKEETVSLKDIKNPVSKTKITMAYSYNTDPVFSVTLNEYRSDHMGVDISAEIGENVKASLDGTVEKVYTDGKLGQCILLKHGSNIKTVYANLDESVSVKAGQTIKQGDVIAKVGNTAAFEIDDPSHLHFEVWQNDKSIDPTQYIK